jgi:nucleoside-diphosphate-sugar epimerase
MTAVDITWYTVMTETDITSKETLQMRIFVTGASGFIGSAVVPELLQAGHQVVGLARSDASACAIAAAGADVLRGELADLDVLRAGAAASDGVIHLGFIHDFANFAAAARTDQLAIEALGTALEGSNRPLVVASGMLGLTAGSVATERDATQVQPGAFVSPRQANVHTALSFVSRGVRTVMIRFAPTVHDAGDHGFIPHVIAVAREKGVSAYIGDGSNRWPAVHRLDAARLVRLAVEAAPAGSSVHAVGEEGIPIRAIAEVIGRKLDVPVVSIAPDAAGEHFGWLAGFLAVDCPASNALTREWLGWEPTHPGLIADLEQGHYFQAQEAAAGTH